MSTISDFRSAEAYMTARLDKSNERFRATDSDENGAVSKTELTDALATKGLNSSRVEKIFNQLDADGDGMISQQEHEDRAHARTYRRLHLSTISDFRSAETYMTARLDKLHERFQVADADENGTVSKTELTDALAAKGLNSSRIEKISNQLDADGDGMISQQEQGDRAPARGDRFSNLAGHRLSGNGEALDSLTSLLKKVAPSIEGEAHKSKLQALQEKIETEGISKNNVLDVISFLADAIPSINSKV